MEFIRKFQLNKVNKNGRLYLPENFSNLEDKIGKGMYGQLGHPDHFGVSLSESTHKIKSVSVQEDDLVICAEVLNLETENVKTVRSILDNLVLSPRGTGSTAPNGTLENYELLTFDLILKSDAGWDVKD